MKAVLLCAGYATRLYPLTENRPKPLLPLAGKPILEYILEKIEPIRAVGQVFVVTNDRFYPHFKKWSETQRRPWEMVIVNDGTTTNENRRGAIGDLIFVIQKYKVKDDLGVFAGDNLFLSEFEGFAEFAESHRPHASLGVVTVENQELARQYGIVSSDSSQRILEFFEKPKHPPTLLASTGAYWFPAESLNFLDRYIREGHNADRPGDYISWLVKADRVFAYPFSGKWFDIGDLNSYRAADQMMQQIKTPTKIKEK